MKSVIIFSPNKEDFERLRVLVKIFFPEVNVFCFGQSKAPGGKFFHEERQKKGS